MTADWLIRKVTGVRLHDIGYTLKACRCEAIEDVSLCSELHSLLSALAKCYGASIKEMVVHHRP